MSLPSLREHANRLRAIPLRAVLLAADAEADRYDQARWHTALGAISVTGCKFFNWNRGCGGGGAIDLVIHLYGLDFQGAIAWLSGRFPVYTPAHPPATTAPAPHLKLPASDADMLPAVKHYLRAQRGIPAAMVGRLIQSGELYADAHANAVFLLLGPARPRSPSEGAGGKEERPVGAELRGTGSHPWRGMAPGSRKDFGYFSIRDTPVHGIILCESAIDAISCFLIHPCCWCISTAGARPNPAWLPAVIRHRLPVHCGFDADPAGDNMADAMIQLYPAILRLRPPHHDWNDTLNARAYPAPRPPPPYSESTPRLLGKKKTTAPCCGSVAHSA